MTGSSQHRRVQLLGLLAERAVFGLRPAQQRQVGRLLEDSGDIDAECMDRLAASLALAEVGQVSEPLPSQLRTAIRRRAVEEIVSQTESDAFHGAGEAAESGFTGPQ